MQVTFPAASPDTPIGQPAAVSNPNMPFASAKAFPGEVADDTTDEGEVDGLDDGGDDDSGDSAESSAADQSGQPSGDANPLIDEATSRFGFTQEEAEGLGDSLQSVLARMDRQAIALMREQLGSGDGDEAGDGSAAPAAPAKNTAAAPAAKQSAGAPAAESNQSILQTKFDKLELNLDANDYDEPTLKTFTSIVDRLNSRDEFIAKQTEVIRELAQLAVQTHGDLSQITSEKQSVNTANFAKEMDGVFTSLGSEFADVFGVGEMGKLAPNSPHVVARNNVVAEIEILKTADARAGRPPQTDAEYARRIIRVQHEDKLAAAARSNVKTQLATQRKKAIAPPSGRSNKSQDPRANALAKIEELLPSMK